jgi:putative zinc finger protein/anti-sigma-K factor RskA
VSSCLEYRELLGGYVLDALEPDETAAVRAHLRSCPRCEREYAELAGLPALLDIAGSADPLPEGPPRELEEAVLDRYALDRRRPAPGRRRPRRPPWRIGLAAAAAGAGVLAILALAGVFSSEPAPSTFGHVHMRGAAGARAEADLRAVRAGTGVRLRASGLSGARRTVYQVWCIADDGRWISGGTFSVNRDGRAEVSLTSAARPGDYEVMLVTRPSARDAAAKHGESVLRGRVEY